jgi:hypothetical protein
MYGFSMYAPGGAEYPSAEAEVAMNVEVTPTKPASTIQRGFMGRILLMR